MIININIYYFLENNQPLSWVLAKPTNNFVRKTIHLPFLTQYHLSMQYVSEQLVQLLLLTPPSND